MRMAFGADDEEEFFAARDNVIERFASWPQRGTADPNDASLLLDWKWGYDDGDLAAWQLEHLDEFLLDWCPRKVSMNPSDAPSMIESLRTFFAFLANEQLLGRGSSALGALDRHLTQSRAPFERAMGDRSRFGMAKSLFAGLGDLGLELDADDPNSAQALMDAFNALPFDERGRILGTPEVVPRDPWRSLTDGIELPPAPVRITDDVDRALLDHQLTSAIDEIRDFVGDGRKLTSKGNLVVADAKALAARLGVDRGALGTPDEPPMYVVRSADNLPATQFRLRLARACGATKMAKGRLSATASWRKLDRLSTVRKVIVALLDKGPLQLKTSDHQWAPRAAYQMLDEGVPHLLAILWAVSGESIAFDEIAEAFAEACLPRLRWGPAMTRDHVERQIASSFSRLVEILEDAGVVVRDRDVRSVDQYAIERREGGELTMTALARTVLGDYLHAAGYSIPVVGELANNALDDVIDHVDDWPAERVRAEFDAWVDAHSADSAVDELARIGAHTDDPQRRIAVIDLVNRLPAPAAERVARLLLDTPIKGHAIAWLLEHEHPDTPVDREAMLRAGVDLLACHVTNDEGFAQAVLGIDDPVTFIDSVWRLTDVHAGDVLAAIGRLHPDASVAKHARKAVIRHRSFLANMR